MKMIYLNTAGREANGAREVSLLSRRNFIRKATVFLPLSLFLGSRLRARGDSFIINRTISSLSQNAISMSNATWARPVTLPVGWSKIRVGCRLHMVNTGATITGGLIYGMGFNSGTANQYGSATCQNFGGMVFDSASWTFHNTSTTYYELPNPTQLFRTRVGTTNTDVAALGSNLSYINSGAGTSSPDRQIFFVDVTHGAPNYTFQQPFTSTNNSPATDVSATDFLTMMAQLVPTPGGTYGVAGPSNVLAVDEGTHGTWNSINFYWNRADATVEICDVAVAVLA